MHQLLELVGDGVLVLDASIRVVHANTAALRLFGVSRDRFLEKGAFSFVVPVDRFLILRALHRVTRRHGARIKTTVRIRTANGVERHLEVLAVNALDETPLNETPLNGVVVTIRDVSDRMRATLELRRRDLQYRDLFTHAADAIVTADHNGFITAVNAQMCAMTGFTADELVGRTVVELYAPEYAQRAAAGFAMLTRGGTVLSERHLRSREGSLLPVEVHARAVTSDTIHAVFRDIRSRRAQEQYAQQVRALESMALLAAGVGHDFNNLLTVINACATALVPADGEPPLDGASRDELQTSLGEALSRAARLAARLTRSGQIAASAVSPTNLGAVVQGTVQCVARILPPTVRVEVAGEVLPSAHADAGIVQDCLLNLARNAIAAMPSGGTLTIRTHRWIEEERRHGADEVPLAEEYLAVTVEDTGIGMDAVTVARAFEPYFTTKAPEGGTGLGLFMVQALMHKLEGRVALRSAPGAGTAVSLLFRPANPQRAD